MHPQTDPRIFYDILTLVIDQLGSEKRYDELNACSRTCQMLLHPSRVHLFSSVRIDKSASRFVTLLKEDSTIADYVQELSYVTHDSDISEDLANAFLLLKNIKSLSFYGPQSSREPEPLDWKLLSPHMQHAFAYLFSSTPISRFYVDNVDNLPATLLSSCATLKHLTIIICHVSSSESVASDNILSPPPQLLSLDLSLDYLSDSRTVMEELPKMQRASGVPIVEFSTLRTLTVSVLNKWQEKHLENILRLTPKLDDIQCTVNHGITPDSWVQKLWIVFPTLRSLKLTWDAYGTAINIAFPDLIKILELLTYQPNCINELFLDLRSHNSDVLDLDWEELDRVLADRSGFPRLKKLVIHLGPRSPFDSWQDSKERIQAGFDQIKSTKFSQLFLIPNFDFNLEVDSWASRRARY